jgi:hypothetical protein
MSSNERQADMLRLARAARHTELTEAVLQAAFGTDPDQWPLRPGAIWRARWDETALLVLIVSYAAAGKVSCAPITLDDDGVDGEVLAVRNAPRLGISAYVWRRLSRELSTAVLERPVDDVGEPVAAWATGAPVPAGASVANEPVPFQGGSYLRTSTEAVMDEFAGIELTTAATAAPAGPSAPIKPTREQLVALEQRLSRPLAQLLPLVDGKRPPTVAEAAALGDIFGITPAVAAVPRGLIVELSHPRWKSAVLNLARRDGLDETAARLAMANSTFALAARQTGAQEPDWRERLSRWVTAQGLRQP